MNYFDHYQLLAEAPHLIPDLAGQLVMQWEPIFPDASIEYFSSKLSRHLNTCDLPIAWVAHADGKALGMASLRILDHENHPDLSPWLGGVYVAPVLREHGIGTRLCQIVEAKAADLGFHSLYLFTLDKQEWYRKQGWRVLKSCTWLNYSGDIIMKNM